jgi:hypothetical protein
MGVLISIMVLALVSTGTVMADPVSAASTNVTSDMSSAQIQSIIDGSGAGDTINFLAGVYSNISLSITKALNLVGNGVTLVGNSTINAVISVANATGVNITDFNIIGNGSKYAVSFTNVSNSSIMSNNISNTSSYGVNIADSGTLANSDNLTITNNQIVNTTGGMNIKGSGMNISNNYIDMCGRINTGISGGTVFNILIQNNTMLNGGDGINLFGLYKNLTIDNNTIMHMQNHYGNGISLVNHGTNKETDTYTTITNNIINDTVYGLFLGGHFTGNISGNSINGSSVAGMNITGKMNSTTGSLNANITNNNITNGGNLGISMENPDVEYLYLDYNNISSAGANIAYNPYYKLNGTLDMGNHNYFSNHPTHIVNASILNNSQIQAIIDNAGAGDTIEFLAGVYSNISLSITKSLNLISDGAVLNGTGTGAVISITGSAASGTNMSNFIINGNGSSGINIIGTHDLNIKNNIIQNCTNAINVNNSGNLNINSNNLSNSSAGVVLFPGYYNVNLKDNNYTQTAYSVVESNNGSGTFTDPSKEVSNVTVTSSYSSSSITNGKTTTYTVKASNNGKGAANSIKLSKILLSSTYADSKIVAVSKGSYDSATGTWNVGSLSSGSDAIIVFTVTAKKAGSISASPSASYTDNDGTKSAIASSTALKINKDVKISYANKVSSSKVKKGKYVYLTSTVSNSGKDKSDSVKVKITVPSGMKLIAVNYNGVYNKATKTWTFTVPAGKAYSFVVKAQVTSKGIKKISFSDNGKIQYKYITGY